MPFYGDFIAIGMEGTFEDPRGKETNKVHVGKEWNRFQNKQCAHYQILEAIWLVNVGI